MPCPQSTEHLVALCTTEDILYKNSRNDLQCGRVPLHSILGEAFRHTPIRIHPFAKVEFRGTYVGHESRVLGQRLDYVDAVRRSKLLDVAPLKTIVTVRVLVTLRSSST